MLDTMTVPTAQCFFDLRGMRPERMTKRPVLAEGEYTLLRIHPCDGSNDMVKCVVTTPLCVSNPRLSMMPITASTLPES